MKKSFFYHCGTQIHRAPKLIIFFWFAVLLGCLPFLGDIITPFKSTGFVDYNSESAKSDKFLDANLPYSHNRIILLYTSATIKNTDPRFVKRISNSLEDLNKLSVKYEVILPAKNNKQLSSNNYSAYAVILLEQNTPIPDALMQQLKTLIKTPKDMTLELGGEEFFVEHINKQTQHDLYKADMIAAPISLITLVLVFASIVAAIIPLLLGGSCAVIILTTLYMIGHFWVLSIFTLNIALLLGLCLSLDYSLFIISRFRDELQNHPVETAVAVTMATAGKAVFFSGLAVFISLSALLLFPITILFSIGIGGLSAVFIAVAVALSLLPALLSLLGNRINLLPIHIFKSQKTTSFWRSLSTAVVKRPLLYFISILSLLLLLGYPFLNARFGLSDYKILPPHAEGRKFFDDYNKAFDENALSPLLLIVSSNDNIVSKKNLNALATLTKKIKNNPLVHNVYSITNAVSGLPNSAYYELYKNPEKITNKSLKQLLLTTTKKHFTTISVVSKYSVNSPETKQLIEDMRDLKPDNALNLRLTGLPIQNNDVLTTIKRIFPFAMAWVIGLTYIVLLVLLRSVFLPFKAILMNIVSLSASYGVLVFIFQEGHLHELLNFDPQGLLDVSLLIIIFCALFGFSMDYEVFLLTRIKEAYLETKDNNQSIIYGIEHSSKLITSAAIIVIFICGSFMVAEVIMVKAFGLGIAIAIFVDAFLVRTILVPATMALVKSWNWYLPKWLDKILPRN